MSFECFKIVCLEVHRALVISFPEIGGSGFEGKNVKIQPDLLNIPGLARSLSISAGENKAVLFQVLSQASIKWECGCCALGLWIKGMLILDTDHGGCIKKVSLWVRFGKNPVKWESTP